MTPPVTTKEESRSLAVGTTKRSSLRGTKQSHNKSEKVFYEPNNIATMKHPLRRTLVQDKYTQQ